MLVDRRQLLMGAVGLSINAWSPQASADQATPIAFDMIYKSFGVRGLEFSDRVLALKGALVEMEGYVAPPLKVESRFFVLTREPLAICPFCQSDADWPVDIVVIYTRGDIRLPPAGSKTLAIGQLGVGSYTDPETGFVSQIRIEDASVRTI
jgi:hypothetical protein